MYSLLSWAKTCFESVDRRSHRPCALLTSSWYLRPCGVLVPPAGPPPWCPEVSTRIGREPSGFSCLRSHASSPSTSSISEASASYIAAFVLASSSTLSFSSRDQVSSGRPRKKFTSHRWGGSPAGADTSRDRPASTASRQARKKVG